MGAKLRHDAYGKEVLGRIAGFNPNPPKKSFGTNAGTFKIDGTIGNDIAVEIESRASKQVRGAVVDVIFHSFFKKLIVIIPAYGNGYTAEQCRVLLKRFAPDATCEVVSLKGDGEKPQLADDVAIVKAAVSRLQKSGARIKRIISQ